MLSPTVWGTSETVLIGESAEHLARDYVLYHSTPTCYCAFYHNEMMNTGFVDGHAKAVNKSFVQDSDNFDFD